MQHIRIAFIAQNTENINAMQLFRCFDSFYYNVGIEIHKTIDFVFHRHAIYHLHIVKTLYEKNKNISKMSKRKEKKNLRFYYKL